MSLVLALLGALRAALRTRTDLTLENLALRQQLALLRRRSKRPQFGRVDRLLWVWLSKRWDGWRKALHLVRTDTVIRWHRQGFRAYWTWKSQRGRTGRPRVASELADLVRTMALANALWGAPRIHGELLKLGFDVSQRTVARLMPGRPKRPSQTWRTFLQNHVADLTSVDFFVVPTATFRILYVFVVLLHHRRRIVHFNVTETPTAAWTARQIVEAFPDDSAPRYLLRDRDGTYGQVFRQRVKGIGIAEVLTAPRSPWQNAFAERVIGTIRRELLDHVIVLNEQHLRRRLLSYFRYYHGWRTHLALEKDAPEPRAVEPPEHGRVVALPHVGGLHHRYVRRAAQPPLTFSPSAIRIGARSALPRRSCRWWRRRCSLMLNSVAPASGWPSACAITAMMGSADRAFRGFNRRDRVLANNSWISSTKPRCYWSGTPVVEPATFALARRRALYLHRFSVLPLIHASTAARRAAWSGKPSALARLSRCLQTLAGKRTDRGTVGPVSVPFLGLPGPALIEIPSFAILAAYGLRRT